MPNGENMQSTRCWLSAACLVFLVGTAWLAIPAQAQTFAYVSNNFSGSVSVIDTTSNTVSATVGVGNCPFGLAVTPNGSHVYVADDCSASVSVIDTATNTVSATVSVSGFALGVAMAPDGARTY